MTNDELLLRLAQTLKKVIGPAVSAEYPKTQAFMAAVVLEKVGRELAAARSHAAANAAAVAALVAALGRDTGGVPPAVASAIAAVGAKGDDAALSQLVAAMYSARAELGADRFNAMLGRIRLTLRAGIDRRMEYAA